MKNPIFLNPITHLVVLRRIFLAIALCLICSLPAVAQHTLRPDFDVLVKQGMDGWGIPGMAIAIVKDGDMVYAKGFGEKKLGGGEHA